MGNVLTTLSFVDSQVSNGCPLGYLYFFLSFFLSSFLSFFFLWGGGGVREVRVMAGAHAGNARGVPFYSFIIQKNIIIFNLLYYLFEKQVMTVFRTSFSAPLK